MKIFIGWDAAQMRAWRVAEFSAERTSAKRLDIERLALVPLISCGLYTRPTIYPTVERPGYFDEISQAPMSTGHAIARFLVPYLCSYQGWALFTDGDVLFRRDVADLFALADPRFAVQVVQHVHAPIETLKMEGQAQTNYHRKNWSSVMLFNCAHPANQGLTAALVNSVPGRDLHRFCWLDDAEIGALPAEWNVLIGEETHPDPAIAHFTLGDPSMPGYEHQAFADEWYAVARAAGYRLDQPARRGAA